MGIGDAHLKMHYENRRIKRYCWKDGTRRYGDYELRIREVLVTVGSVSCLLIAENSL